MSRLHPLCSPSDPPDRSESADLILRDEPEEEEEEPEEEEEEDEDDGKESDDDDDGDGYSE